jgi:hypothetical protein
MMRARCWARGVRDVTEMGARETAAACTKMCELPLLAVVMEEAREHVPPLVWRVVLEGVRVRECSRCLLG